MGQQELMWLYLKLKMIKHKTKEKKEATFLLFILIIFPLFL